MTKVAMMQPAFLPWLGLFELILHSDQFIFLDDFQFVVQSHHTRNRLFVNPGQVDFYSVPVQKAASFEKPLNQALIVENDVWKKKTLKRLASAYGKAPFFKEIFPQVDAWLTRSYTSLAEQNIAGIALFCRLLSIETPCLLSSTFTRETQSAATRTQRVTELLTWAGASLYLSAFGSFDYMKEDGYDAEKYPVIFQNFVPLPYKQVQSKEFIPYLSALDALLNVGPHATRALIEQGTTHWLTFEEREAYHA